MTLTVGYPCSGELEWSKLFISGNPNRISNDDSRPIHFIHSWKSLCRGFESLFQLWNVVWVKVWKDFPLNPSF